MTKEEVDGALEAFLDCAAEAVKFRAIRDRAEQNYAMAAKAAECARKLYLDALASASKERAA